MSKRPGNHTDQKKGDEIFIIRCPKMGFTKREIEICALVRDGRIYKEIGDALFISERTVNKHIQNIFKKAGSNNKFDPDLTLFWSDLFYSRIDNPTILRK